MRSDSSDVNSLVSYIKDIKPFHSKLTEVTVEYQVNDYLNAIIVDDSRMDMNFSSVWEMEFVSDGRRKQYRIPSALFPRFSDDFHQSKFIGITHELPDSPWVYPVPANNGIRSVTVDGQLQTLGLDYEVLENGTRVKFLRFRPALNSDVEIVWAVCDRVFIAIGYLEYDYVSSDTDGLDIPKYDKGLFDSEKSSWIVPNWKEYTVSFPSDFSSGVVLDPAEHEPIGRVKTVLDDKDQSYYVFEFNDIIPLDTRIWIRVEQREAYNGWTQTTIKEDVKFQELVRFSDTLNAFIADPETWSTLGSKSRMDSTLYDPEVFASYTDAHEFGINISTDGELRWFDNALLDNEEFDSAGTLFQLGYYRLFHIDEVLKDSVNTIVSVSRKEQFNDYVKDTVKSTVGESIYTDLGLLPKIKVNVDIADADAPLNGFDLNDFDTVSFDTVIDDQDLFSIEKNNVPTRSGPGNSDVGKAAFRESLSMQIKRITYFDEQNFEESPFDASAIMTVSSYEPDDNGMVYATEPTNFMEIRHYFDYYPMVSVYLEDGRQLYPKSITYPAQNIILVQLNTVQKIRVRVF